MLRRIANEILGLCWAFAVCSPFLLSIVLAQSPIRGFPPGAFQSRSAIDGAFQYTGPGNVASGATAWWGLRAYTSATRGNALINACNVADAACADLSSDATSGALTIPTIGGTACSFSITSGSYVSATGAVSLVIASSPGLSSGNLLAVSALTGTGSVSNLTYAAYAATTGTTGTTVNFTAVSGLGVVTITGGTLSVCTIKKFYSQSGSNCSSANCDLTNNTATARMVLTINCLGSLPCAMGELFVAFYATANNVTISQPYTIVAAAQQVQNSGYRALVSNAAGTGGLYYHNADFDLLVNNVDHAITVSTPVWHVLQGMANAASSSGTIDGSTTAISAASTALASAGLLRGFNDAAAPGDAYRGGWAEMGVWPSDLTSSFSAMNSNVHTYWGF